MFLIGLLVLVCTFAAIAQDETFKVLASKGIAAVQTNGSKETTKLFVGKKLMKSDKIFLGENSYLGLVQVSTGKTLELKKPGTYDVLKLNSELSLQNSSTTKKYSNYIVGELGKNQTEDLARNRYKYMAVTGSVERGSNQIITISPTKADALDTCVFVKWMPLEGTKTYTIEVTTIFGDNVLNKTINGTEAYLNLSSKERIYIWTVYSSVNPSIKSESNSIMFLTSMREYDMKKQDAEIKQSFDQPSALNNMILASFYEYNNLLLDAMKQYEEAIKREPGVEDYKIMYGQFLERNGIAKPETK